ncbi:AAA family ATPase [Nodosilinea sp. LEGE 07298]|uniref:AAA family ATPase n=1 Tax=Nodosilinea sp. LEGE 07298 TaxID=2777970 RepID=UPI001881C055|nr:AAA family ATPase [Nodosilinea sp. LEGE 07298]MBE9113779.1 AAA family ATPase [Nodosilinea sp. LEGE 07298]
MTTILDFNPLKSIAVPNVGRIEPTGLVLVIGPNSAGKTQFLRDIQGRMLGQDRNLVVCDDIEIVRPSDLDPFLEALLAEKHIQRRVDEHNRVYLEPRIPDFGSSKSKSSYQESEVKRFFSLDSRQANPGKSKCMILDLFGRSFISSLFLDRRLTVTNTVESFDYETESPLNELHALYIDSAVKELLAKEAQSVFGKSIWLDNTRANKLCLRVGNGPEMPSAEDRLEPAKMREYRLIEDEGDGFKSYIAICLTLLLGRRPVVLIDEPELCLHPPQAYALGRFIGKYGVSPDHTTFVASHSSHVLRGIIEQTEQLDIIRLSRSAQQFIGQRVSMETLKASIEKPSTKSESILDGLFAEAITVVESEGDRLVYGTTWDTVADEFQRDVHFVSVGGLGGIADPCVLYKTLKIPVCVIADLDVIRELGVLQNILKAIAPTESVREIMSDTQQIVEQVKALGPIYDEEHTQNLLAAMLSERFDWTNVEQLKRIRKDLSELSAGLSQTARLKKGLESLQTYPVYHDLVALLHKCRIHGLFLVPVGELEDWIPLLTTDGPSRKRKAEWANFAANRIRESPTNHGDIWEFVRQMACFQRDEGSRLAGYPTRFSTNF